MTIQILPTATLMKIDYDVLLRINDPSLIIADTSSSFRTLLEFQGRICWLFLLWFLFCLSFALIFHHRRACWFSGEKNKHNHHTLLDSTRQKFRFSSIFFSTLASCVVICIDMTCSVCFFEDCFVTLFNRNQITALKSRTWRNMLVLSERN